MSSPFVKPYPVQFKGSVLACGVLKLLGWKVHFEGLPALQGVAVVYPHTSNWDFPVMVLAKWAIGMPISFWGKDKLFDIPLFGTWMRWIGGKPINRTAPGGVVGEAVRIIKAHKSSNSYFWLGLAPEGTRKLIPGWRSGFYQATLGAEVPLAVVKLDYETKSVSVVDFFRLSGDVAKDMAHIASLYEGVKGFHPGLASPVQILDRKLPREEMVVKA